MEKISLYLIEFLHLFGKKLCVRKKDLFFSRSTRWVNLLWLVNSYCIYRKGDLGWNIKGGSRFDVFYFKIIGVTENFRVNVAVSVVEFAGGGALPSCKFFFLRLIFFKVK